MLRFAALTALAILLGVAFPNSSHAQIRSSGEPAPISIATTASERLQEHQSSLTVSQLRQLPSVADPAADPAVDLATSSSDDLERLVNSRQKAERAHLWRIAAWGGLNAAGGLALVLGTGRDQRPGWWGFGAQSGLWGVVNIGIATAGLLSSADPNATYDAALSAERTYHDILLFNLGLNVAYSAVGTTLVAVSYRGVKSARSLRGHGTSLILQGAGLIVFDAIAFLGSRTRLAGLVDMAGSLSARALPTGLSLTWHLGP